MFQISSFSGHGQQDRLRHCSGCDGVTCFGLCLFSCRPFSDAGVSLAQAFAQLRTMETLKFSLSPHMGVSTVRAVARAMTLYEIQWPDAETVKLICERNWDLWTQARAIAALAKGTANTGFHSLAEKAFRRAVFRFFLPGTSTLMVSDFVTKHPMAQVQIIGPECASASSSPLSSPLSSPMPDPTLLGQGPHALIEPSVDSSDSFDSTTVTTHRQLDWRPLLIP